MKIIIAIDSFKGSISSVQAGGAVKDGALSVFPDADVTVFPLADGGEGTVDALISGMGGEEIHCEVTGPLGEKLDAKYGIIPESGLAIIEMSQAAGIFLVPSDKRNPLNTTTRGVGELIINALDRGCKSFIIGIGGSATNDGGIGMLSALGCKFSDENGTLLEGYGRDLEHIVSVNLDSIDERLASCDISIACDVSNPLCGNNGCSAVFGPQKGADSDMVKSMDAWLKAYAALVSEKLGQDYSEEPGAGAAGGLGFAFKAIVGGVLRPGIQIILDTIGIKQAVQGADIVVTGEGKLDFQTAMGKAPIGVAKLGKSVDATVIAFCGCAEDDAAECNRHGIDAFFPIPRSAMTLEDAMNTENAIANLKATAEQVFRLIKIK